MKNYIQYFWKTRKFILVILIFSISSKYSFSCQPKYSPFCVGEYLYAESYVFSGIVIDKDSLSVTLKILDVLRGNEIKDTIKIWSDGYWDCNGAIDMSVDNYASVGDTILTRVPKIDSLVHSWDVLGDYRRPDWFFNRCTYHIINDSIAGLTSNTDSPLYGAIDYTDFKEIWFENDSSCNKKTTDFKKNLEPQDININPNPTSGSLIIHCETSKINTIRIFDIFGREIYLEEKEPRYYKNIDISLFSNGLYYVKIHSEFGTVIKKIIKK